MKKLNYIINSTFFLLLFFSLTFNTVSYSQTGTREVGKMKNVLAGTSWRVDQSPFENEDTKVYNLSLLNENETEFYYHWGYSISFDEATFSSNYSAPCGNDCFTSVSGEYKFVDYLTISVKVLSIERRMFCNKESEKPNKNYGNYQLEKKENGWIIKKL